MTVLGKEMIHVHSETKQKGMRFHQAIQNVMQLKTYEWGLTGFAQLLKHWPAD